MAKNKFPKGSEQHLHLVAHEIVKEYLRARRFHRPLNGGHEGYAVIKEELDELWDNIKANVGDSPASRKEAIQIAAMALAYVLEVCE